MANASRDNNRIPTLLAVSNVDNVTPVDVWADPTTHRLLVSATGANYADAETPSGAVNGSNVTFTLAHAPSPAASLQFFVNGQLLSPVGVDYTLVGSTITANTAPPTSSVVVCWYRY